jgi:MFS transporter, DHA1 family, multidrug resistance protein
MSAIQCILSAAFSIVPPVLPLMLPGMGIRDNAALRIWAGAILGAAPLAAAITSPGWGRISDRLDRRLIILISCAAAGISTALMCFATHPLELLALRLAMGFFGGHVAASMAMVASATPTGRMGYALGFMATAQLAGTLLGPLIGGVIADAFHSFRAPFFGAAVAAVLVTGLMMRMPARAAPAAPSTAPADTSGQHRHGPALSRGIWLWIVVLLLCQWAILCPQPMISLFVLQLVGPRADLATLAGLAFSIVALSGLLCAPLLGVLGDKFGARRVLLIGVLGAAACNFSQAFAPNYGLFVLQRFGAGLFLAGIIPTANSLLAHHSAAADRGRVYGLSAGATFLGGFLGPLSGGALAAAMGLRSVFIASAVLLAMTAAIVSWNSRVGWNSGAQQRR